MKTSTECWMGIVLAVVFVAGVGTMCARGQDAAAPAAGKDTPKTDASGVAPVTLIGREDGPIRVVSGQGAVTELSPEQIKFRNQYTADAMADEQQRQQQLAEEAQKHREAWLKAQDDQRRAEEEAAKKAAPQQAAPEETPVKPAEVKPGPPGWVIPSRVAPVFPVRGRTGLFGRRHTRTEGTRAGISTPETTGGAESTGPAPGAETGTGTTETE